MAKFNHKLVNLCSLISVLLCWQLRQEFRLCRVYKKTKCLRAFDRRPTGMEIIRNPTNINLQQGHDSRGDRQENASMPSHQSPPPAAVERTSSHEDSSSSGGGGNDGGQPSQTEESEYLNLQMDGNDSQGLWDWDFF